MKLTHKIWVSFLGIIIITILVSQIIVYYKKKQEEEERRRIQEAFKMPSGGDIEDMIKKSFEKIFSQIKKEMGKTVEPIHKIIKKVGDFFTKAMPTFGKNLEYAFDDIGKGIELEFKNLGIGLKTGFKDIFDYMSLFKVVFKYVDDIFKIYIGSRINCGLEKIGNFGTCFLFYIMDLIGYTLYYIFVRLPICIIYTITNGNIDLSPGIKACNDTIDAIDEVIHSIIGYHINRYPQWVLDDCYLCNNLKPIPKFPIKQFQDQAKKINIDWNKAIPELLSQPEAIFQDAGKQLKAAFKFQKSSPFQEEKLPSITEIEKKHGWTGD